MSKKNNKGFLASVIIYPLLLLFLVLLAQFFSIVNVRRGILDKMKSEIFNSTFEEETCSYFVHYNKLKKILITDVGDMVNISLSIHKYESASDLPMELDSLGDIAVITDTEIGEYYVSGFMPSNLKQGDMWFILDDNSSYSYYFDGVSVDLCYAAQYVDGNLELKRFYVYDGKKWK
jgi:hypothetical protein